MKIHYANSINNFGDNLNTWVWKRLIPGCINENDRSLFVGIGSILNEHLPRDKKAAIFGSGFGYGKNVTISKSWKIYCVRGPLTAKMLGIPDRLAVTDSAMLISRLFRQNNGKEYAFGFMPHHVSNDKAGQKLRGMCEEMDIKYIDPSSEIEEVLSGISRCSTLIAEALHGALAADILRVPWIPVDSGRVYNLKWHDWCMTMGLKYTPKHIMPYPWLYYPGFTARQCLEHSAKYLKQRKLMFLSDMLFINKSFSKQLKRISKAEPVLSKDGKVEELTLELEERLDKFKEDFASGEFA